MVSKPSWSAHIVSFSRKIDGPTGNESSSAMKQPSAGLDVVKASIPALEATEAGTPKALQSDDANPPSPLQLTQTSGVPSSKSVPTRLPLAQVGSSHNGAHLLSLPPELVLDLTKFLPFASLLSLRSTCSALHQLLSPSHVLKHREDIISSLLEVEKEQYIEYRNKHPRPNYSHLWDLFYYAFEWQLQERPSKELVCYGCLESKPLHCFVERLASRGTGLNGELARHRRCKDCMRRFYHIQGQWWREHWLRKAEHKKCRGKAERLRRWIIKGESLVETVEKSEQVGVCTQCHGTQFELWWGCVRCFEKEERRMRRIDGERWGVACDDEDDDEGLKGWFLEKSEGIRRRKVARKRKHHTKRLERGRWWRRVWRQTVGGGMLRWEGTWEGRVEALVEVALGEDEDEDEDIQTVKPIKTENGATMLRLPKDDSAADWSPLTTLPLARDRREARCSMCWVPTCRRTKFMLGMAEQSLEPERWCVDCQQEDNERKQRLNWRAQALWGDDGTRSTIWDEDDAAEDLSLALGRLFQNGR
jgi:hypothetical protein